MIRDITDNSPNDALIEQLERLLKEAKAGEISSIIYTAQDLSGRSWHGWQFDGRSDVKKMLAELVLVQSEMALNIAVRDDESILSAILNA